MPNRTDPKVNVTGMISVSIGNRSEATIDRISSGVVIDLGDGNGLMEGGGQSLVSTDPKEIRDFAASDFSTGGMRFLYAVNHQTRAIVRLVKTGNKFAQRDIKPFITEGFTEWSTPNRVPNNWRFPDGEIVPLSGEFDCSPGKTLSLAIQYHRAGAI